MRLTDQSKSLHSARTFLKEIILRKDPSKCKRAFVESKMPTAAIDRQAVAGLAWPGALPPENKSWPHHTQTRCKRTTTSRRLLRSSPSLVATVPLVSGGQSRRVGAYCGCCGEAVDADGRGAGRKKSDVEEDRKGEAWWRRKYATRHGLFFCPIN